MIPAALHRDFRQWAMHAPYRAATEESQFPPAPGVATDRRGGSSAPRRASKGYLGAGYFSVSPALQSSASEDVRVSDIESRIARRIGDHPWFCAWLAMVPFLVLRAGTLAEGDTFFEIRTGLLTIDAGHVPRTDPFSWTMAGHPWTVNSWAFNVLLGEAYRIARLAGVALFGSMVVAGIFWLVLMLAKRAGANAGVAAVVLVCALPMLSIFLTARPQLADYAGVLLLFLLLDRLARGEGRPLSSVVGIGAVVAVWTNLHAATPVVIGLLGASAALGTLWPRTRTRAGWLVMAFSVGTAAVLLNPYGAGAFTQALRVADSVNDSIVEWRHFDPSDPSQLLSVMAALAALVIAIRRRDVITAAVLAVATAGAIDALRMQPIALLVAVPVLASAATKAAVLAYGRSRRDMLIRAAGVGLLVVGGLGVAAATHLGRPDPVHFSPRVVRGIPAGCHVFSSDLLGSYLILERPDVKVSMDTRSDLFGSARVNANLRALAGQDPVPLEGAGCAVIPPRSVLAGQLRSSDGWEPGMSDRAAALFVRVDADQKSR